MIVRDRRTAAAHQRLSAADLLAVRAALSAGATPSEALQAATSPALEMVAAALHSGISLPTLIAGDGTRPDTALGDGAPAGAAGLVRALAMAELVGAAAGPAVDGTLDAVTQAARLDGLVRVRSAQAVLSARFLVGLPVAGALVLAVIDEGARRFTTSPLGVLSVIVALVLIALAAVWIRRMTTAVITAASRVDPLLGEDRTGPSPVAVVAGVIGIVTTVALGPSVGLPAGVTTAVLGGPLRRRVARLDGDSSGDDDGDRHRDHAPARGGPPGRAGRGGAAASLPTVEALELLALALAAGTGLPEAVRLTARMASPEVRDVLNDVAARLRAGHPVAEAFGPRLAEPAHLIDISHRWGAPAAQALRTLADDLRSRAAVVAEEAAERLAVRLVLPTTLLLVPAFGLLVVLPAMASILSGLQLGV